MNVIGIELIDGGVQGLEGVLDMSYFSHSKQFLDFNEEKLWFFKWLQIIMYWMLSLIYTSLKNNMWAGL